MAISILTRERRISSQRDAHIANPQSPLSLSQSSNLYFVSSSFSRSLIFETCSSNSSIRFPKSSIFVMISSLICWNRLCICASMDWTNVVSSSADCGPALESAMSAISCSHFSQRVREWSKERDDFFFPKGEKKELIEKKIKKTAVFTSEKNNLTISHACGKRRREREERRRRTKRTFAAVFCHVWRSEDASAEKTDGGERCVRFDCE